MSDIGGDGADHVTKLRDTSTCHATISIPALQPTLNAVNPPQPIISLSILQYLRHDWNEAGGSI